MPSHIWSAISLCILSSMHGEPETRRTNPPQAEASVQPKDSCSNQAGALKGLCNAYCLAMRCEDSPQASTMACQSVLENYRKHSGGAPPPCVATCESYPAAILAEGPAGYWRLNDSQGATLADSSGHGASGTVWNWNGFGAEGLITEPGNLAGAFGHGGIRLPTELLEFDGSQGLTIEAWVKTTANHAQMVFSQQSCSQRTLQLFVTNNKAVFRLVGYRDDGSAIWDQYAFGTSIVADGLPHHLVGVRDLVTRSISIYVDGIFEGSGPDETQTTGPLIRNIDTWIGRRPWCGQTNEFHGIIDEVAVYRKALTPEQIAAHNRIGRCMQRH